jgi:hypothetical protein
METSGQSLVPVLDGSVKLSKTGGLTARQRIAIDAPDDALVDHGTLRVGPNWPACNLVSLDHWRDACDRHDLADSERPDTRKKAFQRARTNLVDRGMIRILAAKCSGFSTSRTGGTKRDMDRAPRRGVADGGPAAIFGRAGSPVRLPGRAG